MNSDQLEELEALSYIFLNNEMEREKNMLEFFMSDCDNFKIQMIWPLDYPSCALIVCVTDQRLRESLREEIENECNLLVRNI